MNLEMLIGVIFIAYNTAQIGENLQTDLRICGVNER